MDDLIPVERKDETPLRGLSVWVIYRLMREEKLAHVKVGRRRYMTADGIAAFLAAGGEPHEVAFAAARERQRRVAESTLPKVSK